MNSTRLLPTLTSCCMWMALAGVMAPPALAASVTLVQPGTTQPDLTQLTNAPVSVVGRVVPGADGFSYQWPGVYVESAFEGSTFYLRVGPGDVRLRVSADGEPVTTLTRPQPGLYRVDGLAPRRRHQVRIDVLSEHQDGVKRFEGFYLPVDAKPAPLQRAARQIEFIGDSHTVGYGNTSASRTCTQAQVWETTDNTAAFGALIARRYGADYRVNAISGRGVVRNYAGGAGDTVPQAYPYALFDHSATAPSADWQPQVVVIALGTNDFSTPLAANERWTSRALLQADYETTYVGFVQGLRSRYPAAQFVLWATDLSNGEIAAATSKVVDRLRAAGETRVNFVPVASLTMGGCDWHPSQADHETIAKALAAQVERQLPAWGSAK